MHASCIINMPANGQMQIMNWWVRLMTIPLCTWPPGRPDSSMKLEVRSWCRVSSLTSWLKKLWPGAAEDWPPSSFLYLCHVQHLVLFFPLGYVFNTSASAHCAVIQRIKTAWCCFLNLIHTNIQSLAKKHLDLHMLLFDIWQKSVDLHTRHALFAWQ